MKRQLFCIGLLWVGCSLFEKKPQPLPPQTQAASQPTEEPADLSALRPTPSEQLTFAPRSKAEEKVARTLLKELDDIASVPRATLRYDTEKATWIPFALPNDERIVAFAVAPNNDLFALTQTQALRSSDQGASWKVASSLPVPPSSLWIDANGVLFLTGTKGELLRSSTQAASWEQLSKSAHLVSFWGDAKSIFAINKQGKLSRSSDKGSSWEDIKTPNADPLLVVWGDKKGLYAAGQNGVALRSVDQGKTWVALPTATAETINTIVSHDNALYLAGDDGLLLRCDERSCTMLGGMERWIAENPNPVYGPYNSAVEDQREQEPDLTQLISTKEKLWVAGNYSTLKSSDTSEGTPNLEEWGSASLGLEEFQARPVAFVAAPSGALYFVGAQQLYYGLEEAKRGLAARDAKKILDGFDGLELSRWSSKAGYAYGGFLSTPPLDVDEELQEAIDELADAASNNQTIEYEAALWELRAMSSKNSTIALRSYLYANLLAPSPELVKRSKEFKGCLATINMNEFEATPIKSWLDLWKEISNKDSEAPTPAPKNNNAARDALCPGCLPRSGWLAYQTNAWGSEDDYDRTEEDVYHVVFFDQKKKLSAFFSLASYAEGTGRVSDRSPIEVTEGAVPEGILHLTIKTEELTYPYEMQKKVKEMTQDLFFDIKTQTLFLDVEREAFAPHPTKEDFMYLSKVTVVGDEVQITGGGCEQVISLKR